MSDEPTPTTPVAPSTGYRRGLGLGALFGMRRSRPSHEALAGGTSTLMGSLAC